MKVLRNLILNVFVSFLRYVSLFNYRKTIRFFIKNYHPSIKIKKSLNSMQSSSGLIELGMKNNDLLWPLLYSSINGINSNDYIPESIYYFEIEPRLNHLQMRLAYSDKTNYYRLLSQSLNYKLPEVVFMNINGFLYNSEYEKLETNQALDLLSEGKFIIKPSLDSGGGKNVKLFETRLEKPCLVINNIPASPSIKISDILESYGKNFIVQKYISQNVYFGRLNPSSVNTMRLMTYRSIKNDKIYVIQRIMKVGKKNSITDNEWTGSITIGMNANGNLNSFGVNKYGVKTTTVNDIVISEIEKNPFIIKVDQAAKEIANEFHYSRVLGMDFAVDESGTIIFIEANHAFNGINFFQFNNGPLFGKFTDEVISYCLNKNREHFVLY